MERGMTLVCSKFSEMTLHFQMPSTLTSYIEYKDKSILELNSKNIWRPTPPTSQTNRRENKEAHLFSIPSRLTCYTGFASKFWDISYFILFINLAWFSVVWYLFARFKINYDLLWHLSLYLRHNSFKIHLFIFKFIVLTYPIFSIKKMHILDYSGS